MPFVRREIGSPLQGRSDVPYLTKVLASAAGMGLLVWVFSVGFERWLGTDGQVLRFVEVGLGLGVGVLAYVSFARLAGIEEVTTLLRRTLAPLWPWARTR